MQRQERAPRRRGLCDVDVRGPSLVPTDDGAYLVNGGEPIAAMAEVTFRYAWDHFFQMTPRSLEVDGQC
ncbi:hypothetical protein HU200_011877 [Digitaria exilis]|uniref:Uncharacterized protein n=1 Tax=Digitaria exilis TaxID=1010633 RepID=A0A835FFN6_9POAL|nr:hypothetical protein HU200_011877 [Digitaria exilis]